MDFRIFRNPRGPRTRHNCVLIERGTEDQDMTKRILTPIDGREQSEAIVPVVAELAHGEAEFDGIPVERVVRFGEPAEEIRLEAEAFSADLVALATTRRSRLGSALVPGVAEQLEG